MTFKTKLQDGRIPLPTRLRTLAGVADGDRLDVTFDRGRFIVTPAPTGPAKKSKQQRAGFLQELRDNAPDWLKDAWAESKRKGTDKLTMREINAEIAATRREVRTRQRAQLKQPVR